MDEPHDMSTSLILQNDQAAINGIRSAGALQLNLAPGNAYTGGHSSTQDAKGNGPSSDYLYKLVDPTKNTAVDIHEYSDEDFSGTHSACTRSFTENMAHVTAWLKQHNLMVIISKIDGDNNTMCYQYLTEAVQYMNANLQYIVWAYWGVGPLWGTSSACCFSGNQCGSVEANPVEADGSPGIYKTVWLKVMQGIVPKSPRKTGISSIPG